MTKRLIIANEGIMKTISTFLLILTFITGTYSQQSSNPLIDHGSEVLIDRLPENDFYYTHVFQKGQTVYSLARTFKTSVNKIYALNNLSPDTSIDIGQTVKVPFDISALYTEQSSSLQSSNKYVPVYYVAQPKETLYGIGKTYFKQDVETFAKRNKLNGPSISIGQKLLIGWLPLNGDQPVVKVNTTIVKTEQATESEAQTVPRTNTKESVNTEKPTREKFVTTIVTPESINESENEVTVPTPSDIKKEIATASEEISDTLAVTLEEPIVEEVPTTRRRQTRGIGIWERDGTTSRAFVLHHTAKKGSTIELYNPQLNRRTTAKVLGPIPLGTYPSDVSVIMSKKVAESLGALDTRIMVELSFVEDIQ